jgi:hypothetical protein
MKLTELAAMDAEKRANALDDLVARAVSGPPNGGRTSLDARIRTFEARYEITSTDMQARFARGEMRDTSDVAEWLMLLQARSRVR